MGFVSFDICPYSDNDLSAAPRLELREGDLVLRDRGYFSPSEIARHAEVGAECVYRHKTGTVYLDPESGKRIDLPAGLRESGGRLDRVVLLNDEGRPPVRLVSAPVSAEVAALRRMRAKKEAHGHNPPARVLEMMDWTVFVCTVSEDLGFEAVLKMYALRWRIGVIFKTWKSHPGFDQIHRVSEVALRNILTMRLLLITRGTNILYRTCYLEVKRRCGRDLSLQKFLKRLGRSPELAERLTRAIFELGGPEGSESAESAWAREHLMRYCCYDRRSRKKLLPAIQ